MNVVVTINADCTASPDPAVVDRRTADELQWRTSARQFRVDFPGNSPFAQNQFNIASNSAAAAGQAKATASGSYKYTIHQPRQRTG